MLPPIENLLAMPPDAVTELLLAEPEGQWFDRKSARISARSLAETLVAMANAEGGSIAIGFRAGTCEGIDDRPQAQNEWRQAGVNLTLPPVRFESILLHCINARGAADHALLLAIPPSSQVHSTTRDEVFLRTGDENRRLSFEQRIEFQYDRGDTSFEITPASTYGPSPLDVDSVAAYAEQVGHPDPQRLLQARDLVGLDGETRTAGALLFAADPQRAFPQAFVRVLKYAGRERRTGREQNLISDIRCAGRLPQQIDAARQAMREAVPKRRALGPDGRFGWFGMVPEEVWLEALVNAVIHRAYSNFGDHIRLAVFDDRVEVSSPGRFPGITPLGDLLEVRRFARNPRIARVMTDMSYGQELGEGLRRMVAVMEASGRQRPVVRQVAGGVEIALSGALVQPDELRGMPEAARRVFEQIALAGRLRTGELVALTGYSRPVVLRNLHALTSRGLVRRVGHSAKDPQAYWTAELS